MSFDKEYPNRKDIRKPYYKSSRFDHSCRPGGSCPHCSNNRKYRHIKEKMRIEEIEKDYIKENENENL